MIDRNDGGPAFPGIARLQKYQYGRQHPDSYNVESGEGMTLRDYFIAHAPAEPQPWFEPELPPKPEPTPVFTKLYPDHTNAEIKELRDFDADFMEPEDVTETRVRDYLVQKESERKRYLQYSRMAERERYIQWPAAWADAMLAQRSK